MNILLITSNKDKASINLKESLFSKYNYIKVKDNLYKLDNNFYNNIYVFITDKIHLYLGKKDLPFLKEINIDQIIFLSKHSTLSENKPRSMTAHAVGNFSKAELGGLDKTLEKTDPILLRLILYNLKRKKPKEIKPFEIKQEATHHGPYLDLPIIFYEIGSDKNAWENKKVANFMIDNLINILKDYNKQEIKKQNNWIEAVGVGGSHYATKFNKKTFSSINKFCFGHIIPNYALSHIEKDKSLISQALKKSNSNKIIYNDDL